MTLIDRQRYRQTVQHNTAYKLYTELVSSFKEREYRALIITILLMIIITSACIALSVRTIQRQYTEIAKETEFFEYIEEHSIQVY